MSEMRDALLEPSLTTSPEPVQLYSPYALFVTSFFGGAFAGLMLSGLNARAMGRLRQDRIWYVLGAVVSVIWLVGVVLFTKFETELATSIFGTARFAARLLVRGFGIAMAAALYRLHRPQYKASEIAGADYRGAWKAGIACIVLAMVVQFIVLLPLAILVSG